MKAVIWIGIGLTEMRVMEKMAGLVREDGNIEEATGLLMTRVTIHLLELLALGNQIIMIIMITCLSGAYCIIPIIILEIVSIIYYLLLYDVLYFRATENPSESGGSFDASGAFHGGVYSDEDDDGITAASQEGRTRRVSEGSASNVIKSSNKSLFGTNSVQSLNRHTNNTVNTLNKEQPKLLKPLENKTDPLVKERRNTSPTKPVILHATENISTKILPVSSNLSQKKVAGSVNIDKVKDEKFQSDDTEINKSPSRTHNKEAVQSTEIKTDQVTTTTNRPVPLHTEVSKTVHNPAPVNITQGIEEIDLDRMVDIEADAFITKLTADEEILKEKTANVPPPIGNQPSAVSSTNNQEKWFYCDPQGQVQGPFSPSEMSEWCKAGYFTAGLMIRRACDERYATLGELTKLCGRVPFTSGLQIPPLLKVQ